MKNKKQRRVRVIALILVAAMIFLAVASFLISIVAAEESSDLPEATEWMAEIPDDTPVSCITIPGTHDSASNFIFPGYFLKCQNTSIKEQLENGYRYLDIRLSLDESKDGTVRLKFIHNFGTCKKESGLFKDALYLEDVLEWVYAFLEDHPTETVIFCVKDEGKNDDPASFESLFFDTIDENPDMWYTKNMIPDLSEVRGKIILATRFPDANDEGDLRTGLNFRWEEQNSKEVVELPYVQSMINDDQALWVQDRFKYNVDNKIDAFMDDLDNCQADENTFSLNFSSTSGSGTLSHPKGYAQVINKAVLERELESGTAYGVLIIDFATKELAQHIYSANF